MNYNTKPLILAVDDNMKNLQLIVNVLQNNNYDTAVAVNGEEAIDYFETESADLILLDIMMPDIDGFEVCERLRSNQNTRDIPIIFLTARADSESIAEGFKHGGVDYLTKPFNKTELLARVKTHVDLKLSRDRLMRSEQELKELNSTKDKFFSIIAHDLKNPMHGLITLSELLFNVDKSDTKSVNELTHMLNDMVLNQYKLLENLLEWSSLQTKRRKVFKVKCCINELIHDTVFLYQPVAKNKNITLKIEKHHDNEHVFADQRMIETVLRNLVSNAIKFTNEKGRIILEILNKDEKFIRIVVKDNGVGIQEEDQPKLFRLDENFSMHGTNDEKGSGLGLILCKELIERNDGKIDFESRPGFGTKFMVDLLKFNNT